MSKVDELAERIAGDMEATWAGYSPSFKECLAVVKRLIKAVRQEERDRINTLLENYELHDHTACHGGEPTWIVVRKGDDIPSRGTLYSSPINALLSKEGK